jgi:uncharacterized protein YfcZ (UPF0381/DUF406 family)
VSDDTLTSVASLIALITDAKACAKRLTELQAKLDAAEEAQAKLDAEARSLAADKAAVDEQIKAVREREVAVAIAERALHAGQQALAADRRAMAPTLGFDPNLNPGSQSWSGLTREPNSNG